MAPFCAHDCLHHHVRWGDNATALHTLGWARDPELLDALSSGAASLWQRCLSRREKPSTEAGASMYPPWHDARLRVLDAHRAQVASGTVVPTFPGQREVFFHASWAYAIDVNSTLIYKLGGAVAALSLGAEQFHLGRQGAHGFIEAIEPEDSWAAFYWRLRYRSVIYEDGAFASIEYHEHVDLDSAIAL